MKMKMFIRGLKGAILGASIAASIAVIVSVLLLGFQIVVSDVNNQIDRENDFKRFIYMLPIVALAGIFIGGIGGLVAKLPSKGVRMLTSISVVAGCAVLTRLPVTLVPRYKGSPEPSYIPMIIAVLVGGTLLLVYEVVVMKREKKNGDN